VSDNKEANMYNRYKWYSLIWMAYMVYPIYAIVQMPAAEMWIGFTLIVIFLAAYWLSILHNSYLLLKALPLIIIIGYFSVRYDSAFLFMGFYTSPIIGRLPSKKQFFTALGMLVILDSVIFIYYGRSMTQDSVMNLIPTIAIMLAFPFIIKGGIRSRELKLKLNVANEEIARLIKNEERERISRDLHDTLGHTLSLITLKSELAEKLIVKQSDRAIQEVKDIQMTARSALKQVRELVSGLSMSSIQEEVRQAEKILAVAFIDFVVFGNIRGLKAAPLVQNILAMCLRESVTNVVKHSKAKRCTLELTEEPGQIIMTIRDDGIGICKEDDASDSSSSGHGLLGMKERLDLIDGKLHFQSGNDGSGTQLIITVPRIMKNQQAGETIG
jgi:two-component system sensor histidine kinase DesK